MRSSALRFLDWSGFTVEERPDGLDWLVDGQRVQIRYTVGPETSLRVSLHTDLAEVTEPESPSANGLDLRRRAAAWATRLNDSVPLSVIVASDNRLQLRCVVSITPTGRTMLRVLHTAALLHAYWGMRLRWELAKTPGTRVGIEGDGWPDPEVAPPLMEKALFDVLLNDDQWLLSRWGSIRPHLTQTMSELGYQPGWGNDEVQFYNELPPDIAVAVLEPENPTWSWLGRGVVIQARTLPGADAAHLIPNYSPQAPDEETLNALNTALFSFGLSVLKGFSAAYANQGGYQIDCWIPVAGVADPSLGDAGNATSLGNLASHVAGAPFRLHRELLDAINAN